MENRINIKKTIIFICLAMLSFLLILGIATSEPSLAGEWKPKNGESVPFGFPEHLYLRNDTIGYVDWVEVRWYTENGVLTLEPQSNWFKTAKFEYQVIKQNLYLYNNDEYAIYDKY